MFLNNLYNIVEGMGSDGLKAIRLFTYLGSDNTYYVNFDHVRASKVVPSVNLDDRAFIDLLPGIMIVDVYFLVVLSIASAC